MLSLWQLVNLLSNSEIKNLLTRVQLEGKDDDIETVSGFMPEIVSRIQEFNRICKRKKSKKKKVTKK